MTAFTAAFESLGFFYKQKALVTIRKHHVNKIELILVYRFALRMLIKTFEENRWSGRSICLKHFLPGISADSFRPVCDKLREYLKLEFGSLSQAGEPHSDFEMPA